MLKKHLFGGLILLPLVFACAPAASAAGQQNHVVKATKMAGPDKLVLQVLPAEPFLSRAERRSGKHGMVRIGGAAPVTLHASPAPNHHLIVHVLSAATGKPVRHAHVRISYRPLAQAKMKPKNLPIVEMEVNGKGAVSTHYGNNVYLKAGRYVIWVRAGHGPVTVFRVKVN